MLKRMCAMPVAGALGVVGAGGAIALLLWAGVISCGRLLASL